MIRSLTKTLCATCRAHAKEFMADDKAQLNLGGSIPSINEVTGATDDSNAPSFSRDFNIGDFDSFGGDVTEGKFVEIARFKVPADTEYSFGYGAARNPENQGYIYIDLQNGTPGAVEGTLRLKVESSTGRNAEVVKDLDTETLDATKTNREEKVPLPEQVDSPVATQDAYLVMELNPSNDDTIDQTESDIIVPITEYDFS